MDKAPDNTPIYATELVAMNNGTLREVQNSHNSFCYFTTVHTAEKILSSEIENYIYVSPISKMNDLHERELHSSDGDSVFGLCFCNSDMDNIPMWYLYAGISGEGARIGITASKMCRFISNITHIYAVDEMKIGRRLERGIDFDFTFGWIFYRQNEHLIKYRKNYYSLIDSLSAFENQNYFVKDVEWKYEKEFRIVFYVYNDPPEKIAVPINKKALMEKGGGLSVMLAPELRPKTNEEWYAEKYAKRFGLPKDKVKFSKLKIKMDLLSRNQYTIIERFSDVLNNLDEKNTENVCKQMQSRHFCAQIKEKMEDMSHV